MSGVHSNDLRETIEALCERSGENASLLDELCRTVDAVCAFASAPLRCHGCDNPTRDVGAYQVRFHDNGDVFETIYCSDCSREVASGFWGEGSFVCSERGSGRLDFLIGCLIAALLAFAIILGGTVAP